MATALKDKLVTLEDLQQTYSKLKGELDEMGEVSTANITLSGDVTAKSATVAKHGKIVEISIRDMYYTNSSNGYGTIPAGYRPIMNVFIPSTMAQTHDDGFTISPEGKLTLHNTSTGDNYAQGCNSFYFCG